MTFSAWYWPFQRNKKSIFNIRGMLLNEGQIVLNVSNFQLKHTQYADIFISFGGLIFKATRE